MVKKNVTPHSTPLAESGLKTRTPQMEFAVAAASMSWQLAVVVLLPVIGGFKLDQHLHSAPLWTAVGFVLAITGMVMVLKRMLSELAPKTTTKVNGNRT